jgi:hypothetical protein
MTLHEDRDYCQLYKVLQFHYIVTYIYSPIQTPFIDSVKRSETGVERLSAEAK